MRFLVLLLTYIVQRRFNISLSRQLDQLCLACQQYVSQQWLAGRKSLTETQRGWLLLVITVLLPTLLLGLLCWLVQGWLFGVFSFFLQILALFWVLGCPQLKRELDAYLQAWREADFQAAFLHAQLIGYRLDASVDRPARLHRQVWEEFLMQTFSRYFSIIFWFMLAGPTGALLARLLVQAAEAGYSKSLQRIAGILDHWMQWIPARLLALSFALAGNFVDTMRFCLDDLIDPACRARQLLAKAAEGALHGSLAGTQMGKDVQAERDVQQLLGLKDLLNRSIAVWLAVLAVMVIANWTL